MKKAIVSTVVWLVFSLTLAIPALAGEVTPSSRSIAEIHVSPSRVEWIPAVDVESWTLTLAGPRDFLLRRQFEAGEVPFLSLSDSEGNRLSDGGYAWELRGVKQSEADASGETPRPRRSSGDIYKGLRDQQIVAQGRILIKGGSFIATGNSAGDTPEPPLPNFTEKDSLLSGRFSNDGNGCIGDECNSLNDADFSALKLRSTLPHLKFDDVELPCEGCPTNNPHDWAVFINQSDTNQFAVSELVDDVLTSTPFTLRGGAPDNSLFISSAGNVGIGTASPSRRLHVITTSSSENVVLELQNNAASRARFTNSTTGEAWNIGHQNPSGGGFVISDVGDTTAEMFLDGAGNVIFTGTVTSGSSRAIKEGFSRIDTQEVLRRVVELPITTWSYKETPKVRHVGPMSEDFFAAFGTGSDDKGISVTDSAGVALAAIQGLHQRIEELETQNAALMKRLQALEETLAAKAAP